MRYTSLHGALLALHILAAIVLLGPVIAAVGMSPRLVRMGYEGVGALRSAARTTRVYGYGSLLVFVLGMALVQPSYGWSFSQAWLGASMGLFLTGLALVVVGVVPAQQAAMTAMLNRQEAGSTVRRIAITGGLASLCWAAVLVLMVFKPGLV